MSATKKKTLLLVLACIVIPAAWFTAGSYQPFRYSHNENLQTKDELLATAYRTLKSGPILGWEDAAYRVGAYGDPDEATEAILDLIEYRADATRENTKEVENWPEAAILRLQAGTYLWRLQVLTYLGLTNTKRAEEYLLNAYKNPQDVVPNKKWVQAGNKLRATSLPGYADSRFFDAVTRRYAFIGLLLLDEPTYSLMLEEDFYALVPDAERISKEKLPDRSEEDRELYSSSGVLLDLLGIRDVIRERGTEYPEYLLSPGALKGPVTKYWNFQSETAVARP